MEKNKLLLEMKGISKSFGEVTALSNVDFKIYQNEINALAGANGSGKTTLMSILYGIYQPDSGFIKIKNKKVILKNPFIAKTYGLGMIYQHFKLINNFTALENTILGNEICFAKILSYKKAEKQFLKINDDYKLGLEPNVLIGDCSVNFKQKLELLKILFQKTEIIIFDEPTAVLTNFEVESLFKIFLELKKQGKTIIFIAHKLEEILRIADRVTVLRKGHLIGSYLTKFLNEEILTELIVGKKLKKSIYQEKKLLQKHKKIFDEYILKVKNLSLLKNSKLKSEGVSFSVQRGEIVVICGVDGNGQKELVKYLFGLEKNPSGKIYFLGKKINSFTEIRNNCQVVLVPEDCQNQAILAEETVAFNSVLQTINNYTDRFFIDWEKIKVVANTIKDNFLIDGIASSDTLLKHLSGGNQQKFVLGREAMKKFELLIIIEPTRGLDVLSTLNIHQFLFTLKKQNKALLLFIFDLKEAFLLADRLFVINKGRFKGEFYRGNFDFKKISNLML